ncbi:MAG TPA: single-stranded DNA-binding protein [Gaiellaceae bacterium]|nr:single-stranded DNA-binding protein [Gaiellaceae bacterium]
MNLVMLIGNLATDVELREFGEEKRLATFRLAVDRGGKDEEADFFRISVWDRQAQTCADYLAKGRKVAVEGRLRTSSWEDNGEKRSRVEVVARRVEFLPSPPSTSTAEVVPFEAAVA